MIWSEDDWYTPKQTWNLKMGAPWKRRFLLETIISRFHVNFWGCTPRDKRRWVLGKSLNIDRFNLIHLNHLKNGWSFHCHVRDFGGVSLIGVTSCLSQKRVTPVSFCWKWWGSRSDHVLIFLQPSWAPYFQVNYILLLILGNEIMHHNYYCLICP